MKIQKLRDVETPVRGTELSAGLDFFVPNDWEKEEVTLQPNEAILIESGIKVDVPKGFVLVGFNKSSKAVKKNLQLGACVIDEDYQGEVLIHIRNVGTTPITIERGKSIAQFVLLPVFYDDIEVVEGELFKKKSERGEGKLGSTDKKLKK